MQTIHISFVFMKSNDTTKTVRISSFTSEIANKVKEKHGVSLIHLIEEAVIELAKKKYKIKNI